MPNIMDVKYTSKMEADLDKIDSGDQGLLIDMIRHYYEEFQARWKGKGGNTQGVKIKLKGRDGCGLRKCRRNMVIKVGLHSKFWLAPAARCKNTRSPGVLRPRPSARCCR